MKPPACFRFSILFVLTALAFPVSAQPPPLSAGPDPREIPLPPIQTPMGRLPGVRELPSQPDLPDILTMADGTKVKTLAQWRQRRSEMLRLLEYYAVGQAPPAPGNVKGREIASVVVAKGKVRYRLVHLSFGPEEKLGLDIGIFTPAAGGPFPVVIAQASTPPLATPLPRLDNGPTQGRGQDVLLLVGPTIPPALLAESGPARPTRVSHRLPTDPEEIAATNPALARGYAYVMYDQNDCGEDTTLREADGSWSFRRTRFFPAYPGYDWGLLRAWAWGASRIADYLETDPTIDRTKMIITGVSRTGKSAMVAAAFDERLMGAPVVTGGGGVGAYRFAGPGDSETLDLMQRKYPNWFSPNLHEFWGHVDKLPFDEHWFLALCAPRPFVALEGDSDAISWPDAVKQSILAARAAYALYGAEDKLGVHYSRHGHAFTGDDWTAMLNFADRHLLGKAPCTFDRFLTVAEREAALAAAKKNAL